jgi:hypothetical protein
VIKIANNPSLSVIFASSLALGGCGGSSGSSPPDERSTVTGGTAPPTLSFTANPATVEAGGYATLTWSARGADGCEASAGWTGSRGVTGSQQVGPVEAATEFRLSCAGPGGGVSAQVALAVDDGSGPAITLRAEPEQVPVDGTTTLTWSAPGAESCTATGAWSGSRPTSGSITTSALAQSSSFGLSCTNANGNALSTVTVAVLDRTLRWDAPTQTVDGEPLSQLGGYVVYWGAESGTYTGNHRIDDGTVTEWRTDVEAGEYYFALTAIDQDGNESDYSNEVRKTIQ